MVSDDGRAAVDRQIVQSEPTRPKPQWVAGKNDGDDDGFDDILQ